MCSSRFAIPDLKRPMRRCGRCSGRKSISGSDRTEEARTMNDIAATASPPKPAEVLPAKRRSWLGKAAQRLVLLLPGIAILVFWQWAAGRLIKEIYVSKPSAVAVRLYEVFSSGEIYPHLWTTGQELVLGYVIGVSGGILAGYRLRRSPRLASIFEPYVMAFYGVPKIALAPLFIIWFGIGIWSKVALASIMVFFLLFYNVYSGVRAVDRELVNLTLVMGANQRQSAAPRKPRPAGLRRKAASTRRPISRSRRSAARLRCRRRSRTSASTPSCYRRRKVFSRPNRAPARS